MTTFPVHGGCHCGAVRYTLAGPAVSVQHCHCSRCRKLFGSLVATGAVIRRAQLMIEGEANSRDVSQLTQLHGQVLQDLRLSSVRL